MGSIRETGAKNPYCSYPGILKELFIIEVLMLSELFAIIGPLKEGSYK